MTYGTLPARKITIETDDSQVVIDRDARVMLADRSVHGDEGIIRLLSESIHDNCDMVLAIGVMTAERHKVDG